MKRNTRLFQNVLFCYLFRPSEDAFDNLFYNKACEDWKAKLIAGDFTPEMKLKQKQEAEREKARVDPWKVLLSFPEFPPDSFIIAHGYKNYFCVHRENTLNQFGGTPT